MPRKTAATAVAAAPPKTRSRSKPPDLRIANPADNAASSKAAFPHLTPTSDPDVFRNEAGSFVDRHGVLMSFRAAVLTEDERAQRLLGGPADTPAKVLKMVALDTTMPMMMRLDAAKAAAPYFDKKTPIAVENKNEDFTIDVAALAALPREKRLALLKTLREIGVDLGPGVPES
jgi:hypothetical protein